MNNWTEVRVKIINFFKRNKKKIIIGIIIWLIILLINYIFKLNRNRINAPSTTYKPHTTIMDNQKEVPKKYQQPIENLVDTYFNYCNNGEYEKAYELITDECKQANYPTLEQFKGYIDEVFEGKKKIYNLQSYSIVDNKYIYNIRILDDILANGTTDGYYYYEEKIILIEENGKMKLSIAEYIGDQKMEKTVEDEDIKIEILNKSVDYENETYTIKVTNKTDYNMILCDNTQNNEIVLSMDNGATREPIPTQILLMYLPRKTSREYKVTFNKFYDDDATSTSITFGAIRILEKYDWQQGTTEEDLKNALRLFSFEVPLT